MAISNSTPPGAPGIPARWTSSAKSGLGKSMNHSASNVIFTLSHGIVNEVYYPREDLACIRDMELIITDGREFFCEEKRDTIHDIKWMKEGVPAFHLTNTSKDKRFTIEKEIITDPFRDTLLQKVTFKKTKKNDNTKYRLFVLLAPHLNNQGAGNDGWLGDYKGIPMLFAHRDGVTLALACFYSDFLKRSVGYVGTSDGYRDLKEHKKMEWEYAKVNNGNIALTAEIDIQKTNEFVLALSFGLKEEDAANRAWASLLDGFEKTKERYISEWDGFQKNLKSVKTDKNTIGKDFRVSATVMNLHQSKKFPGGVVASLSIPWGNTKGDNDLGGYHLVWPRDLVESSGGFLALKSKDEVLKILNYLMSTQEADGKWSQNMWLEGIPWWTGIQMDEIALPILLVEQCERKYNLSPDRLKRYWPGIKKAISFLVINGPSTQQDRWEEESGLSSFTLAAEITGLLSAAYLADLNDEPDIAQFCREVADFWNEQIENWTYVTDTPFSKEAGIDGYYMRINPYHLPAEEVKNNFIYIKNHTKENGKMHLYELVCVDALSLVRFGLRAADDPKILNTVKLIDEKLKVNTPNGPCWHRYTNDGYGEDKYGNGFSNNGQGIGRAWPLLTGERAHYEIAAGNIAEAKKLLKAMDAFANNGLLPEQIWDTDDIPEKGLFFGQHSGSAMPLTWAHSEYIKLCYSIKAKKIFDMSSGTYDRYVTKKTGSPFMVWRFTFPCTIISPEKILRIEVRAAAIVHWTADNWETKNDIDTTDSKVGIHYADIDFQKKKSGEIKFTFFWKDANHWEDKNFMVKIESK
jgi:glucoamylase